ncbi:MAG: hypothetical protein R3C13_11340 [Hyphomonas sp.]|uniref:hypothetical protein n=1 Tax=Hyphomonas sp. TaxID=87 RepID=UPI003528307D
MEWLDKVQIYFVGNPNTAPNGWIYNYQTLVAGLLAFIAAFVAALLLWQQHRELIDRRYRALRASLPLALSELHDYTQECLQLLSNAIKYKQDPTAKLDGSLPALPPTALSTITELIAFANKQDAKMLQAILRQVQIQRSRLHSQFREMVAKTDDAMAPSYHQLKDDVLDAFVIQKMANHLFPYARWEVEHVPQEIDISRSHEYSMATIFPETFREYVSENLGKMVVRAFKDRT